MASREWLEKTVNTKGRPCPLRLADPCPGTTEGCAFWLEEIIQNSDNDVAVQSGCAFMFQYVQQHNTVLESMRVGTGLDKVANEVAKVSVPLRLIRMLENGNSSKVIQANNPDTS